MNFQWINIKLGIERSQTQFTIQRPEVHRHILPKADQSLMSKRHIPDIPIYIDIRLFRTEIRKKSFFLAG